MTPSSVSVVSNSLRRRGATIAVFSLSLALIVSGCGQSASSTPGTRTIQIEMSDFAFTPSSITLTAGEKVTLLLKNVGTVEHEFMAGKDPVIGRGYAKDLIAAAQPETNGEHGMDHTGAGVRVQPSRLASLTIIVPAGWSEVEFACFVPAHYEIGMRGQIVIDPETAPSPFATPRAGASGRASGTLMPSHAPMGDDDGEGH